MDGFSLDAALFAVNTNRPFSNSFEEFNTKTASSSKLNRITAMNTDNETPYYIYGKKTARWSRAFVHKYPYKAEIDNNKLEGELLLTNRKPLADPLCVCGDSGAAVIDENSNLVAMLYGGTDRTGLALVTPITTILEGFDDNLELAI